VRGVLDAVLIGGETHIDAGLDYESQAFAICAATADMKEGTSAFLERRKPVFRGQ
jgi:enoyl-CoA hydratase